MKKLFYILLSSLPMMGLHVQEKMLLKAVSSLNVGAVQHIVESGSFAISNAERDEALQVIEAIIKTPDTISGRVLSWLKLISGLTLLVPASLCVNDGYKNNHDAAKATSYFDLVSRFFNWRTSRYHKDTEGVMPVIYQHPHQPLIAFSGAALAVGAYLTGYSMYELVRTKNNNPRYIKALAIKALLQSIKPGEIVGMQQESQVSPAQK